jgi:hypothetical protein
LEFTLSAIYRQEKSTPLYPSEIAPIFDANLKICIEKVAFSGLIQKQEFRKKPSLSGEKFGSLELTPFKKTGKSYPTNATTSLSHT